MKTIHWGIIGCGDVTEVKSGPGFQKADHSALVAVMRRNGALAKDYAKRHGVPKWYDDAQALIQHVHPGIGRPAIDRGEIHGGPSRTGRLQIGRPSR